MVEHLPPRADTCTVPSHPRPLTLALTALTAAAGLTAALALAVAPDTGEAAAADTTSRPAASAASRHARACTTPQPATAQQWQALFAGLRGRWEGGDVASTVALPDGRVLWLFGDTLHATERGLRARHNSMLMGERGCLTPVRGTAGHEPLPTRADGQWYWPTHGIVEDETLFVIAHRVTRTGKGVFDFAVTGVDLFEFALRPGKAPLLESVHPTPSSKASEQQVQYGAAVLQHQGHTYVYGATKVDRDWVYGRDVRVARVPRGHLADPAAWRYWTGSNWVADPRGAAVVIPGVTGVPSAFSLAGRPDGGVVGVAKQHDFLGTDLVAVSAPTPVGPWTVTKVGVSPSGQEPGALTYMALAHPDLRLASGRLLVGVSRNNTDPTRVAADPQRYRPEFHEVALP